MIRYTKSALADIDQAITYLEERNPAAAELRARFETVIGQLSRFPELGRTGRVGGTRERTVPDTRYIVAYRVVGSDIQIVPSGIRVGAGRIISTDRQGGVRAQARRAPDHHGDGAEVGPLRRLSFDF